MVFFTFGFGESLSLYYESLVVAYVSSSGVVGGENLQLFLGVHARREGLFLVQA